MDNDKLVTEVSQHFKINELSRELAEATIKLVKQQEEIKQLKKMVEHERARKLMWRRWYDNEAAVTDTLREQIYQLIQDKDNE